jgi:hypothetical protein
MKQERYDRKFIDSRILTYDPTGKTPHGQVVREQMERIRQILRVASPDEIGRVTERLVELCHDQDMHISLAAIKTFFPIVFTAMSMCPPEQTAASTCPDVEEYGRKFLTKIQQEYEKNVKGLPAAQTIDVRGLESE